MSEPESQPEERTFTIEEANELLPWLTDVLPRIRQIRQTILAGAERIRRSARLDGGGSQGKEYWEALDSLRQDVEELSKRGVVLRDAETGLVDFPAVQQGDRVFLCWRIGEDRVGFWHDLKAGFSGRKPL
jgi:hypothetical protein